jgi:hypothetical protein
MDIFQRAATLLERAQSRMADAASQGGRAVNGAQIRALETRQSDLRRRIEYAAQELGKLAFRRWKTATTTDDATMLSLCEQLDRLNNEYQYLTGALVDARRGSPSYGSQPTFAQSLPPYPSSPAYPAPAAGGFPGGYSSQAPVALSGMASPAFDASWPPAANPLPPYQTPEPTVPPSGWMVPPPAPPPARPLKPDRECPECLSMVPGTTDYCPTCGMRV